MVQLSGLEFETKVINDVFHITQDSKREYKKTKLNKIYSLF